MNYREVLKEVLQGVSPEEQSKFAAGIKEMDDKVDSLQKQGLLPRRFARASEALHFPLNPIHYRIEIPEVSQEVYAETRKAVEATGAFITTIRSVTMEDLLREDQEREQRGEPRRLDHVGDSETMRDTLPPEMEVFIDPKAVRIEGSNKLSTDQQKMKIAEEEAKFKAQLPEVIRPFVSMLMVDPSTLSQLEDAWMDAGNGLLFPNYSARTNIQLSGGTVAVVGRYDSDLPRNVSLSSRDDGDVLVFAVPVGVLPHKLAT